MSSRPTRRDIILSSAVATTSLAFAEELFAQGQLAPTPACGADSAPTLSQTEGPYFKTRSPERQSLIESGVAGRRLELTGFVLTRSCKPVAKALVDFWQADANGAYDNAGFRLRGHQFTDADGRYRLSTIIPARYPGRTPHIHVKVQAPSRPVLTTQLYFPGESANENDRLFRSELLIRMAQGGGAAAGQFDFVLDMA
ncbi:MAG: intradiol ring-cleavage dioxygenase [Bradyrhizobiaceae bacterium]|nr:intradiol ring-cleavage dioxygenase [Bradyrhizobiaceae bacterium]